MNESYINTLKPQRDSQRSKVYAAERRWHAHLYNEANITLKRLTLSEYRRIVADLAAYFGFPVPSVYVNGRLGRRVTGRYFKQSHRIELAPGATVATLLHELAHAATPGYKHSDEYAAAHVRIVREYLGAQAADLLGLAYRTGGVKRNPQKAQKARAKNLQAAARKTPQYGDLDRGYALAYNGSTAWYIGMWMGNDGWPTQSASRVKVWKTAQGAVRAAHKHSALGLQWVAAPLDLEYDGRSWKAKMDRYGLAPMAPAQRGN